MNDFIGYLSQQIEAGKNDIARLEKEERKDDADFIKVRTNIYEVCKTVTNALAERPGAEADCIANPDLTFISFEEGQGFVASEADVSIAVGMQKGSPLLEKINEALAQLDAETRYQMMEDAKLRQPLSE